MLEHTQPRTYVHHSFPCAYTIPTSLVIFSCFFKLTFEHPSFNEVNTTCPMWVILIFTTCFSTFSWCRRYGRVCGRREEGVQRRKCKVCSMHLIMPQTTRSFIKLTCTHARTHWYTKRSQCSNQRGDMIRLPHPPYLG